MSFWCFKALLLGRRYWKWNSFGELVETCFGMNRAAILALSVFPVVLQMALCGEPRGKCLALQSWCIPGMSFPTINCLNSLLVLESEREQLCSLGMTEKMFLWPGPLDPVVSTVALVLYCVCGWSFGRRNTFSSGVAVWWTLTSFTIQLKPLALKFPELFQEMSILWLGD